MVNTDTSYRYAAARRVHTLDGMITRCWYQHRYKFTTGTQQRLESRLFLKTVSLKQVPQNEAGIGSEWLRCYFPEP